MSAPKLFVSYSWTDQAHMDWVIELATELRSNGVDTILDKWHLREGQDSYAFMEQMVTNPEVTKVIVVCDCKYTEKADNRLGGVGAESQIMSADLYGKVDQTKFVAVCRENDENGRALLPAFLRSRIYIDFVDDDLYSEHFEQLLRWCFDKPLYVEPELGKAPAFLDDKLSPIIRQRVEYSRSAKVGSGAVGRSSAVVEFFRSISDEEALPSIAAVQGLPDDENIYNSILGLSPIILRVMETFERAVREEATVNVAAEEVHRYLEVIVSHYERGSSSWSGDVLKFYGNFLLVASISILIENGRGAVADELLSTPFVLDEYGGMTAKGVSFSRLGAFLKSIDARNQRLQLRRLSLHADLIKQVCDSSNIKFRSFIQSDLALFIRSAMIDDRWWPNSVLYVSDSHGALPWYIRAVTERHRANLLKVLRIDNKAEHDSLISDLKSGKIRNPEWGGAWSSADTMTLANLNAISEAW